MPAKAAGTSMKKFSQKCTKKTYKRENFFNDDLFFRQEVQEVDPDLLPKFMTSHIFHGGILLKMYQYLSSNPNSKPNNANKRNITKDNNKNLLIYLHRNEYDRFPSAVKQAARVFLQNTSSKESYKRSIRLKESGKEHTISIHNPFHSTFDEEFLMELIHEKYFEIGLGTNEILTCEVYNFILFADGSMNAYDLTTNMAFIDYKEVEKLQNILAEQECPDLIGEPYRLNIDNEKKQLLTVLLKNPEEGGPKQVSIDEWLHSKKELFEPLLKDWEKGKCQDETRTMEDELFQCQSKFILV